MDFKSMVKDENVWIPNEEMHNIPDAIQKEYFYLKENVQKNDICGALFRLKDIYEISMKIPAIMAVLSISSYMKFDDEFTRKTNDQLKLKRSNYMQGKNDEIEEETEASKRFRLILSRLLREPLSIGSWSELIEIIVAYSALFELDSNLVTILSRTIHLFEVKPQKVNGEDGRYANVINWRNKTIGHGTLLLNTDDYWEQAYDLVKGLYTYFSEDAEGVSLNACYERIYITREEDDKYILQIGNKRLAISEYIYHFDDEHYFFDSYYSRQKYTEVTNYFAAPKRLKSNSYYQRLYYHFIADEKRRKPKKRGRQITNSADREMYACLNSVPDYEKLAFVIDEIKKFINENNKGVLYIQMERGMGKSTLAHRLDGRYQKGILQKDLNAVVRVYHISDTRLRGEQRRRDFFTALNTNLISYEGGQLEVDNDDYNNSDGKDLRQLISYEGGQLEVDDDDDYYNSDGNDLRQLMKIDTEDAQIAFSEYLELFRRRYEEELYGDTVGDEINLVYIIDGIDELNSDTKSILQAIPSDGLLKELPEETVNHVYIVLLSRTKEEESMPDAAKDCVDISEQKAGRIFTVNSSNEEYIALLKKYIRHNYKELSETACEDIIERAQRKFLYVQPYMALGDAILKTDGKFTAYEVAENYVTELKKMYRGVSSNTLQLIISAIAVFHSISLKEICNLVLFTDVSYDVIGVLNDILPLLAVRRTDGDDVYEFANEGYEQYVLSKLRESVREVICRFRISVNSWGGRGGYGKSAIGYKNEKDWSYYIKKILYVDSLAKEIHFEEVDEEYVASLCYLWQGSPDTMYSKEVSELMHANIIDQLKALHYKELTIVNIHQLLIVRLEFDSSGMGWSRELNKKMSEYTQGMIAHCMANQKIDIWFKMLTYFKIDLRHDFLDEGLKLRVSAFKKIVEQWAEKTEVVQYFCDKIIADYLKDCDYLSDETVSNNDYIPYEWFISYKSYGVYLEELLSIVETEPLRKRVYEGLLYAYSSLVIAISKDPRNGNVDSGRRETILRIVDEAAAYRDPSYDNFIYDIKMWLLEEPVDKKIFELEALSGKIHDFSADEHYDKFHRLRLEEALDEEQLTRYKKAGKLYLNAVLHYLKDTFDENNADDIYPWLMYFPAEMIHSFYSDDKSEMVLGLLDLYESLVKVYAERSDTDKLSALSGPYKRVLACYDKIFRCANIGFYHHRLHEPVDVSLKMTSWEKTYALYCSAFDDARDFPQLFDLDGGVIIFRNDFHGAHDFAGQFKEGDKIPCLANDFINKLLQELYEEEYEKYCSLNEQIEQAYSSLKLIDDYFYGVKHVGNKAFKNYYRWLSSRYYRSLEGKDSLTPDLLYDYLNETYNQIFYKLLFHLDRADDIVHTKGLESYFHYYIDLIAYLSEIIPDSITSLNDSKDMFVDRLEELRKEYSDNEKINEWIDSIIVRINEASK